MNPQSIQFFSQQEETRQKARIVTIIIYAVWITYFVTMVTGFIYNDKNLVGVTLAGCVLQIAPYILVRRGDVHASSLLVENALREKEIQYRNMADSGIALIWMSGTDKLCNYRLARRPLKKSDLTAVFILADQRMYAEKAARKAV